MLWLWQQLDYKKQILGPGCMSIGALMVFYEFAFILFLFYFILFFFFFPKWQQEHVDKTRYSYTQCQDHD